MDFVKMEGLGNDFIVVDGPVALTAEAITAWCDRRFGVGADGVLEVTPVASDRIRMRYWNADGGEAEMCGNGLRCLARLAVDRGWVAGNEMVVETASGDLPATVQPDGLVRALVGTPRIAGDPFEAGGVFVHPVRVGNPHAVVFVDDADAAPVDELGPRLEHDEAFPDRANVEFVQSLGGSAVRMRVWERGVGETMASGTGATAAAFAATTYREANSPVSVELRGGELRIEIIDGRAWMTGPGRTVFTGTLAEPGPT
jgi:diaminopimelate epimerase